MIYADYFLLTKIFKFFDLYCFFLRVAKIFAVFFTADLFVPTNIFADYN